MAIDEFTSIATVGNVHDPELIATPTPLRTKDTGVYCLAFTAEADGSGNFSVVLPEMNGFFGRISLIKYSEYDTAAGSSYDHASGTLTVKDAHGLGYTAATFGTASIVEVTLSPTLPASGIAGKLTITFASLGADNRIRVALYITGSPT